MFLLGSAPGPFEGRALGLGSKVWFKVQGLRFRALGLGSKV